MEQLSRFIESRMEEGKSLPTSIIMETRLDFGKGLKKRAPMRAYVPNLLEVGHGRITCSARKIVAELSPVIAINFINNKHSLQFSNEK